VNAYAVLILSALLVEYFLNLAADLLNLKALRPDVPADFADTYDAERYAKSQEYTRARTRFGFVPSTFNLVLLLVFWFAGGFPWLDGVVRGFELSPIPTGLAFIGILAVARTLLSIPFSWCSTFVIEERFGFNKTTPKTFVADTLKGLLLAIVLGGPLLAVILWFFEATGSLAWLWCWLVTAGFTLFIQFIAPTWIFPLFNKFEPLDEGELGARLVVADLHVGRADVRVEGGGGRAARHAADDRAAGVDELVALPRDARALGDEAHQPPPRSCLQHPLDGGAPAEVLAVLDGLDHDARLDGVRRVVELVAVERHPRLEPERVAGAEADGRDAVLLAGLEQRVPDLGGVGRLEVQLVAVLARVARARDHGGHVAHGATVEVVVLQSAGVAAAQGRDGVHRPRTLDRDHGQLVGLVVELDAVTVGHLPHPGQVAIAVAGVDAEEDLVLVAVDEDVVHGRAVLPREERVADRAQLHLLDVRVDEELGRLLPPLAEQAAASHVAQVEEAGGGAHAPHLVEDAVVLHRHQEAGEVDQPGSGLLVEVRQRRAAEVGGGHGDGLLGAGRQTGR